jgi:pimeloyl-ACP methyl ester carboxylesterase
MKKLKPAICIQRAVLAGLLLIAGAVHADDADGANPQSACAQLKALLIEGTTISDAQPVAADTAINGPRQMVLQGQPAHCLVHGEVGHHLGKNGENYGNRFELRMPEQWSRRFLYQGGGGLDGHVNAALGSQGAGIETALARGYAVVASDGGHEEANLAGPGSFGADPQALADYEYASTRAVTEAATRIVAAYYHRPIQHSYFMGCSTGGREALIAAQRYPELFDGIIAGDPAFHLTRAMVAEAWNTQALAAVAPRDAAGKPDLPKALSDAELRMLAGAVTQQCDALDGVRDGLINDPLACHFDPRALVCAKGQTDGCLAADKVAAIRKIFAGPADSHGAPLYSDWAYDAGIASPGWRLWILGTEQMPALNVIISPQAINGMALANAAPPIDILHFDFDRDYLRVDGVASALNATSTDYTRLKQHRGKLLLYTGMSDPVFSANDLIRYFRAVMSANGGSQSTAAFARLFLIPGMNHCAGGPATDQFDALNSMQEWVESGSAPARIIAKGAMFPGRTRPLCPFPQVARFEGSGDSENAASFECR